MEPRFLPSHGRITLTTQESALFCKLIEVVDTSQCNATMRVAGGWVRDKLLGLHSEDIDIALDNMMGETFANLIVAHMKSSKSHGVVKANPEASKHLETACINVMGFELDLVNLRSEDYSHTSRIPTIVSAMQAFGTPEQDALRRDLTINSLFYNIQTQQIEDWTGSGISDLEHKIARTPLPPLQTFLDDPLRVFRAIRFTARFSLSMDSDIRSAAVDPQVQRMLLTKVSRERISKEYTLMMKGNNPFQALDLLYELRQIEVLLRVPGDVENRIESGYAAAGNLRDVEIGSEESSRQSGTFVAITAALISPYRNETLKIPKKKTTTSLIEFICSESLKVKVT